MSQTETRSYHRTLEDVQTVIGHAKLEQSEIRNISQVIYMTDSPADYKLLELNQDILQALKTGERIVFRGSKEDRAVLCTDSKTYEVKEAETSNSLLLMPELKFAEDIPLNGTSERVLEEKEIVGIYHEYLELRAVSPKLNNLKALLEKSAYRGVELEHEIKSSELHNFDSLLEAAQTSEKELREALNHLGAFQLHGFWRILDFDYEFRALSFVLNLLDENSWPLDQVPIGETLSTLRDLLPAEILQHVFQMYLRPTGDFTDESDELFSLDQLKVSKFLAEVLLRPVEKFNLKDFQDAWQQSVPEGIITNLEQLAGIALYDTEARPPVIWFFPQEKLPEDIHERFQKLFEVRQKWTLDEISPYIERLATGKQTVNALLTKHARASNINGVRYYSSRHGK